MACDLLIQSPLNFEQRGVWALMSVFIWFLKIISHFNKSSIKKVLNYFAVVALFISIYNLAYSFQLTLAWDPNPEPDLAGYKLYYGTESTEYGQGVDINKNESVTISGLELSKRYYFAVTAYDLQGNESDFSDEISYHLCWCDLNRDGSCNILDKLLLSRDWGRTDCNEPETEPCECDLNQDGSCNILDKVLFRQDWGRTECLIP